jgi:MFS family permease
MAIDKPVEEPSPAGKGTGMAKRAALSAFLGSTVEYYDFVLFATASALVFNKVYFGALGPGGATLASFATFGVAYVARPLGAIIFGSLGDKWGRVKTLTSTLVLMGIATFLIGILPDYNAIGFAAPLMLVILRLLQGLSAGGEQAGSNSLSLEHAPKAKRGLYTSWTMQGTSFGSLLASAIFIPITSMVPADLLSWGWRIPFLIAAPLVLVALYIRRSVGETEAFHQTKATNQEAKVPVFAVLRDYWPSVLRVIGCSLLAVSGSILGVFALGYAVNTAGVSANMMLTLSTVTAVIALVSQPLWAMFSDRIGRRPVFAGGMIAVAILIFPFFAILSTGNVLLIFLMMVLINIVATASNGVGASMYSEMFPTHVRYTGVALGTQLGFVVAGFAPAIATAIQGKGSTGWVPVAIFGAVCFLIAAASAWSARETRGLELAQLGNNQKETNAEQAVVVEAPAV